MPFCGTLDPDNRWVLLAELIPWHELEEAYALQGKPAEEVGLEILHRNLVFAPISHDLSSDVTSLSCRHGVTPADLAAIKVHPRSRPKAAVHLLELPR